jgi:hypothetical protein
LENFFSAGQLPFCHYFRLLSKKEYFIYDFSVIILGSPDKLKEICSEGPLNASALVAPELAAYCDP